MHGLTSAVSVVCVLFPLPAAAVEHVVGQQVVAIDTQPLRSDASEAAAPVDEVFAGLAVYVQQVQGDRLLVSRGKPGWIHRKHVIPLSKAPTFFNEKVSDDPSSKKWLFARACVSDVLGDCDLAIADCTKLIEQDRLSSALWNARGSALNSKGAYDKAIEDFNEAIRLDPRGAISFNNRGWSWHQKEEYEKAIADRSKAIRLDPKYAASYHERGMTWRAMGNYEKAIADYEGALRQDPNYVMAVRTARKITSVYRDR